MFTLLNKSKKIIKKIKKQVKNIEEVQNSLKNLSLNELKDYSQKLKNRYSKEKKIDNILVEAAAIIREATERKYSIKLFDVQIIAGIALDEKIIAEMKTGEGKTFAAMLTSFIGFIKGEQLYIATANEYLAKRDSEITAAVLEELGVSTSFLYPSQPQNERMVAYNADIVYGTTVFFAFDYLKDNLALSTENVLQKTRFNILIDEADLSLIDQASTPLSITGDKGKEDIFIYTLFKDNITYFENKDDLKLFEKDSETQDITLLDEGYTYLENFLIENKFINKKEEMYISKNLKYLHILNNTLKAKYIYKLDNDYVLQDGEAMIIDNKTGRVSKGRRWGNGLHQAIEAKENLEIQQ